GALCALTGLYHRNITGKGQHIDLSQMVASVPLVGPALLDVTVNGRGSRRAGYPPGNRAHWPGTPLLNNYRGPTVAPHNAALSEPPATTHLPSPMIGEHTSEIVEDLLGYSHEELRAGFADGTFWPHQRPRFPYQEEMLR